MLMVIILVSQTLAFKMIMEILIILIIFMIATYISSFVLFKQSDKFPPNILHFPFTIMEREREREKENIRCPHTHSHIWNIQHTPLKTADLFTCSRVFWDRSTFALPPPIQKTVIEQDAKYRFKGEQRRLTIRGRPFQSHTADNTTADANAERFSERACGCEREPIRQLFSLIDFV